MVIVNSKDEVFILTFGLSVIPERIWTPEEIQLFMEEVGGRKFQAVIMEHTKSTGTGTAQVLPSLRLILIDFVGGRDV
jgi:hypothetical protein